MADHLSPLRATVEAWNAHDRDRYVDFYTPDAGLHGFPPPITGPDSLADFFVGMWAAVPDARIVLDDAIQDGDRVAGRFTVTGTHEGILMGVPASHRTFTFGVMGFFRFDDEGRIAERWNAADFLSMLQQIGAVPAPAAA